MVFAEFDRRRRRDFAHRIRLGIQVLTTAAYGSVGVAIADPFLRNGTFGFGQMVALTFGLVCAFFALYLAPRGERYVEL